VSFLLDPFQFEFFTRGLIATVIVGAVCGALGPFVIVRRLAYIGQGLSQSVLGGVGIGLVAGLGLYPSAIAATAVAAALIDRLGRRRGLYVDTAIGIVSTGMFAAGVAVISANRSRALNINNVLFGNVLGVGWTDLIAVGTVAALAAGALAWWYKSLLFTTHDPEVARAQGVNTARMELLFNVLLAAVIITALQVLGVLLITAVLIIPAATARLVHQDFGDILKTSMAIGVVGGVIGLYVSYYINIASGPAIVLTHLAIFTVAATTVALVDRQRLTRAQSAAPSNDLDPGATLSTTTRRS
jgi:ABC-type Mn2+/Zn2+ transport system permease subunit